MWTKRRAQLRSRWRKQNNGLMQGSVLAPTLFNTCTNDQPILDETRNFIFVDNLCITAQYQSLKKIEDTIEEALDNRTTFYHSNSMCANTNKNNAFHPRNREANKSPKVVWDGTELKNTTQ